jgi:hypothetical protein
MRNRGTRRAAFLSVTYLSIVAGSRRDGKAPTSYTTRFRSTWCKMGSMARTSVQFRNKKQRKGDRPFL